MRVIIADDHSLVRRALRSLLQEYGYEVAGEAENGREAVELARTLRPDIVLMDLAMPIMDGLAATRLLSAELPATRVVMLTGSEEDEDLLEAVKSGASGYLLKNTGTDQFFESLERVARGEPVLTHALAPKVLSELTDRTPNGEASSTLTEREWEVLELMAQGITSDRELAARLFVSTNTVKYHLRNILGKLHMRNRAQVVAYAYRHGLINERESAER